MKKHTLYYIALSALAMLTGCSNEENFGLKPTDGNRSLTATIEQNDLSRTAVSEEGQVTWTETDAIGVFGTASQNIRFTYQSSTDNGNSATFRGDFPEEETMEQAYYPYQEDATLSGNALTLNLPSEYTYTGNSNAPMLGIKNNDGTFTFKHLTGLLRITINNVPEEADRFVITSSGETDAPDLAGQATITDINAEDATLSITANESKSITYNLGTLIEETGFRTFFVPLPVGEYPQLSVALYAKDSTDPYFTKTISDITVRRAVMIDMPILDAQTGAQYVLSENTTEITESMAEHISVSPDDNTTLIYGSGIAEEDVPQVGDIIFAKVSDNFPDGFLGKVSNIQKNNDGSYTVETGVASLSEAFDELYINETAVLIPEDEIRTRNSRTEAFNIELKSGISYKYGNPDQPLYAKTEISYGAIFYFSVSLDKKRKIEQAAVTLVKAFTIDGELGASGTFPNIEENGQIKKPLGEKRFLPLTLGPGIIRIIPVISSNFIMKVKGSIENKLKISTSIKTYSGSEYKNGEWVGRSSEREQGINNKTPLKFLDNEVGGDLTFKGEGFIGFSFPIEARLYGRKDMAINLEPEAGIGMEAQIEVNEENSQSIEQILSDATVSIWLDINAKFNADASLIVPGDLKKEYTIFQGKLFKREIPLFPDIKKPEAKVTPEETTEAEPEPTYAADVETEVQGPTLMEDVEIAYAIEDEATGEVLEISEPIPYSGDIEGELMGGETPIEEVKPVKTAFKELKQEVSYIVYPVISSPFLNSVIKKYDMSLKQQAININIAPEKSEREILIEFYNATGGDNWTNNENWCTDEPLNTWYGITTDNEGKVTEIKLRENNLTSDGCLNGLNNLRILYLDSNQLTSMKIANLPELTIFDIIRNEQLTDLNISNLPQLTILDSYSCCLTELNLPDLPNLTTLRINNNSLTNIDLSNFANLETLNINFNLLTELNVKENPNITHLECANNQLTSLDLSGLKNLNRLQCAANQLTNLDLSGLKNLDYVSCGNNPQLTTLTVAGDENLTELLCNNCQLTGLDISGTVKLESLDCYYNQLTSLNASDSKNLVSLRCFGNQLKTLNVHSSKLTSLWCVNNQLTDLDLSNAENILVLECGSNQLSYLDLSKLLKIKTLSCGGNQISELDFSNNKEIESIWCSSNLITNLDLSNMESLTDLTCSDNPLKVLDVSNCKNLKELFFQNNINPDHQTEILNISGVNSDLIGRVSFGGKYGSLIKKVYLTTQEEEFKTNLVLHTWGERNSQKYPKPNHWEGFQYPEYIYVDK